MQQAYVRRVILVLACVVHAAFIYFLFPFQSDALNIHTYKDTITDSAPGELSNHTLSFNLKTAVSPGGSFDLQPPSGFEILATSTFDVRNVELYVNGVPRDASSTLSATEDQVVITTGSPGLIEYTLNPSNGIPDDAQLEFRIGNHTSNASVYSVTYSTSTGTTTTYADSEPIRNSSTTGTHKFAVTVNGGDAPAFAQFSIAIIDQVAVGPADTTEEVPPFRFNGAPTGTIGGTTLSVELSLETDELAECRFSQTADTDFFSMSDVFDYTGLIIHSETRQVATNTTNTYYVRCIDDEGNYNTDDYEITFISPPPPEGTPNEEGDVEGDGTGSGNEGTGSGESGSGSGTGGGSGGSSGGSSGGGGSGGGSGGSSGPDDENESGGGFESSNAPYRSGDAEVIIRGYAFPGSTVYVLVDGNSADSTRAGNDGSYSITLEEIARGVYTFGVYAVGSDNVRSSTFSTSFTVTGGRTSNLSNINVMPSVAASPNPVSPGETLTVSGRSIPNAEITIENQNDKSTASKKTFTTTSNGSGVWSLEIDTSGFSSGTYKVRAKSKQLAGLGIETNFSGYTYYGVGQEASGGLNADLNTDGRVNLTDFSILLFWWGGNGGNSNPPADINGDGSVSLTDFSIMLFNWTG